MNKFQKETVEKIKSEETRTVEWVITLTGGFLILYANYEANGVSLYKRWCISGSGRIVK